MGKKTANGIHEHTIKIRWFVLSIACFVLVFRLILFGYNDCDRLNLFELSVKIRQKYATKKRTSNFQKEMKKKKFTNDL